MLAPLVVLLGLLPATAATLPDDIDALAESASALRGASWGAKAVATATGAVVYEHNADHYFLPASNAKLFSTALALRRLGPEHRFETLIVADAEPDGDGAIAGDLRLIGGGDPTLSAREYPYREGSVRGDPLGPVEELAAQLVERGVRRVDGDIVGDDSAYAWEPYPDGWGAEDTAWDYGAPVGALIIHDNAFRLSVLPGSGAGQPARLLLNPPVDYYQFRNRVRTVSEGETNVWVEWPAGSREITVWGTIRPGDGRAKLLAVRDPADYGAWVLADALRRRGVEITGEPRARHRSIHEAPEAWHRNGEPPAGTVLARRESPPLFEILQVINKVSLNLHAEILLPEVGRVRRKDGTRAAGLAEMTRFLAEAGVGSREFDFEDASGLSRLNVVTPDATVKLLSYMFLSEDRDGWIETLAAGGSDGTLDYRFRGSSLAGRVHAKTGTLTHVTALSGYADSRTHGTIAFSIFVNNHTSSSASVRAVLDRMVRLLLE